MGNKLSIGNKKGTPKEPLSVPERVVRKTLVLSDLGDRASRAAVEAHAAGDAGILVHYRGDVLELQDALGAIVDADAASDARIGINNRMSHSNPPLDMPAR